MLCVSLKSNEMEDSRIMTLGLTVGFIMLIVFINVGQVDATYTMADICGSTINMTADDEYASFLRFQQDSFGPHTDNCSVEIFSRPPWTRLMFKFEGLWNLSDSCLFIYQKQGDQLYKFPDMKEKYCDDDVPETNIQHTTAVDNRTLYLNFVRGSNRQTGFMLYFSIFHLRDECKDYKCKNNRCIPNDINCNRKDPCGDQSDCLKKENEQCVDADCKKDDKDKEYTPHIIAGVCIAVAILIIVIIICCIIKRRRSSNAHTYKAPTKTQESLQLEQPT